MDIAVLALRTTVIGMGTVFLVLVLIALVIEYVLQKGFGRTKPTARPVKEQKEVEETSGISPELVVAITAAAAVMENDRSFFIRKIRRVESGWAQAGREEIMKGRRLFRQRKESAWG